MILFLDTSALVKLYIAEPGSERLREAVSRDEPLVVSILAFPEFHATVARRTREGLLEAEEREQIHQSFAEDWKALTQVPLGAQVLTSIRALCETYPLRGADAVHLASALLLKDESLPVTFVCADQRLLEAASAEGLAILDLLLDTA